MLLGIESEIYLSAHDSHDSKTELKTFVKTLADKHNKELPCIYRRMQTSLAGHDTKSNFSQWAMAEELYMGDAPAGGKPFCKLTTRSN
jgi:hypothetical protein